MVFVETLKFTEQITDLSTDEDYADFQEELAKSPEKAGPISGCGGVRKVRMAAKGKGKSGGARILYLYLKRHQLIYLLYLFTKGDADNLSAQGKRAVRELAKQISDQYK
jgi:hypothetical protein